MAISNLNYILITPAKNEEANLPGLIASVANQTMKPIAWFIVNDGSSDRTCEIISESALEYPWIHILNIKEKHEYDLAKYYSGVCRRGFDFGLEYCQNNNISYEYVGLSDADMIYPPDYFSKCVEYLHQNVSFGIVSGYVLIRKQDGKLFKEPWVQFDSGEPYGGCRVWNKQAFTDTGGYILTKSPDTVSNIKARLKGWEIAQLQNLFVYQTRDTDGKFSLWKGGANTGTKDYYLHINPLSMLNGIIFSLFFARSKPAIIKAFAAFYGYSLSYVKREAQIDDDQIKNYLGSYKRVFRHYWIFFRNNIHII